VPQATRDERPTNAYVDGSIDRNGAVERADLAAFVAALR
jgi:hypothetical protein